MTTGSTSLAESVLDTMRKHLGLSIGVVDVSRLGVGDVWRVDATDGSGERCVAEHEDCHTAPCMLAELVGFDLEDG